MNCTERGRCAARALIAVIAAALTGAAAAAAPAGAGATAQEPRSAPVPVEQFFQQPAVLDAKLSPSGTRLAFTTGLGGSRVSLAVFDVGAGTPPRRVAQFIDADVTEFHWVGDQRLVLKVRDLQAGSGEDRYQGPGLYAVDADGQAFRRLVRRKGRSFVSNGAVQELEWNHALLHVPRMQDGVRPDEVVIGELNFDARELSAIVPQWLNTRTGRTRSLDGVRGSPEKATGWWFDSQGRPRLAAVYDKGRRQLHWRGPADTAWRVIDDAPQLAVRFAVEEVGDDGTLYVTRPEGAAGTDVLTRFDFGSGTPVAEPMVRTPGFDFQGELIREQPGGPVLGVRTDTDAESTTWFDGAMKRLQAQVDAALPGRINRIQCRRCGATDAVVLVRSYADSDPGELLLFDTAAKRWQRVAQVRADIDPQRMARVDFHRIRARDGLDLPVWVTTPAGAKRGVPLPAVVMVHGGPWVRGQHWRWEPMAQFLASRGYVVIGPEFRGSTGYGSAHFQAGWKQWGQAMQDDVADALLWAQREGLAGPRACIAGASYGGYSTLMGLARHPELYRCGIAWVAVTDPFLMLEGAWWMDDDVSDQARRYNLPTMVGDATRDAAMLTAASPLAQAERIRAPVLLAYGESDVRVPLAHGRRLRDALTRAGRPPEWVTYANEAHSWRLLETRVDFARRVEKFLAEHLPQPLGDKP